MTTPLERRRFLQSTLAAGCALAGWPAHAAAGRVLFGFLPGGTTRAIASAMLTELQKQYRPDLGSMPTYMPGNAGGVAIEAAHRAAPDGSTVLLMPSSVMTLTPYFRKLASADTMSDFVPVASCGDLTLVFAVGPAVPDSVKSMADYIRWVRENPMSRNYGVPALGSAAHFAGVQFARTTDLPLRAEPYKGTVAMMNDLSQGHVPAAVTVLSRTGDAALESPVRFLAVSSDQRWPGFPDLPTLRELGLSEAPLVESFGFFMDARTPDAKVRELRAAVQDAVQAAAVRKALSDAAMRPAVATDDYASEVRREHDRWGQLVKSFNFSEES